jgi:hypothetical protein
MSRTVSRAALAALLVCGAGVADDPPAKPKPPAAAPDWSGFVKFSEVTGTVVKADENGLTLQVVWYTDSSTAAGGGGGMTAYRALQGGRTPTPRTRTPPKLKENKEDYELLFADAGLARWDRLALGPGAGGKFVPSDVQNKLKLPPGAPGWAAARSDLAEGQVVEVTLVRPKDVPLAKATPNDLRVKYAVIQSVPVKSAVLEKEKDKKK